MLDKLKLTEKDNNHCKLIENKLGFVVNPETKKMVYKLFPECEIKNNNKNNNKKIIKIIIKILIKKLIKILIKK